MFSSNTSDREWKFFFFRIFGFFCSVSRLYWSLIFIFYPYNGLWVSTMKALLLIVNVIGSSYVVHHTWPMATSIGFLGHRHLYHRHHHHPAGLFRRASPHAWNWVSISFFFCSSFVEIFPTNGSQNTFPCIFFSKRFIIRPCLVDILV